MKIFTLILSIYVLLLSSISCADGIGEPSLDNYSSIVKTSTTAPHSDCCGDICSPFCACACCVGFTKPVALTVSFFTSELFQVYFNHQPKKYWAEPIPLFQPPRA